MFNINFITFLINVIRIILSDDIVITIKLVFLLITKLFSLMKRLKTLGFLFNYIF